MDEALCSSGSVGAPDHALGTGTTNEDCDGRNEIGEEGTYHCGGTEGNFCNVYTNLLGEMTVLQQS